MGFRWWIWEFDFTLNNVVELNKIKLEVPEVAGFKRLIKLTSNYCIKGVKDESN